MIRWKELQSAGQIQDIITQSARMPCLIYKHSTRCSISSMARLNLEEDWSFSPDELTPYFLDIIAHPDLSKAVAAQFDVHHESPQVLLIRDGECTYEASHLEISVRELRECYHDKI